MSKYELSVSPDYVPGWNVIDAVRELFQNALDQQTTVGDNQMFFDYDGEDVLTIGNRSSVLDVKTLLLGVTTKRDDDRTIGKFGEGYKIATLVLLRLGKVVTFYNYGNREVWKPKLVNSRRYKTKILTFFVDKKFIWQSVPDNNLTIKIEGITPEEYEEIVESNLHLQELNEVVETEFGRIIYDEKCKGKVYVNGLLVCNHDPYEYGYDFKPQYIRIDRDRKLVSDFDLQWLSSKMWNNVGGEKVVDLAKNNSADVRYITNTISYSASNIKQAEACNKAYYDFIEEYGSNAVPVVDQKELAAIPNSYKPVIVSESYKTLVTLSEHYEKPEEPEESTVLTIAERLHIWLEKAYNDLPEDLIEEFEAILKDLEEPF